MSPTNNSDILIQQRFYSYFIDSYIDINFKDKSPLEIVKAYKQIENDLQANPESFYNDFYKKSINILEPYELLVTAIAKKDTELTNYILEQNQPFSNELYIKTNLATENILQSAAINTPSVLNMMLKDIENLSLENKINILTNKSFTNKTVFDLSLSIDDNDINLRLVSLKTEVEDYKKQQDEVFKRKQHEQEQETDILKEQIKLEGAKQIYGSQIKTEQEFKQKFLYIINLKTDPKPAPNSCPNVQRKFNMIKDILNLSKPKDLKWALNTINSLNKKELKTFLSSKDLYRHNGTQVKGFEIIGHSMLAIDLSMENRRIYFKTLFNKILTTLEPIEIVDELKKPIFAHQGFNTGLSMGVLCNTFDFLQNQDLNTNLEFNVSYLSYVYKQDLELQKQLLNNLTPKQFCEKHMRLFKDEKDRGRLAVYSPFVGDTYYYYDDLSPSDFPGYFKTKSLQTSKLSPELEKLILKVEINHQIKLLQSELDDVMSGISNDLDKTVYQNSGKNLLEVIKESYQAYDIGDINSLQLKNIWSKAIIKAKPVLNKHHGCMAWLNKVKKFLSCVFGLNINRSSVSIAENLSEQTDELEVPTYHPIDKEQDTHEIIIEKNLVDEDIEENDLNINHINKPSTG